MEGTIFKKLFCCVFIILFALASCLSTAEARQNHVHHKHFHHPVKPYPLQSPPSPAPASSPTPPPSSSLEEPSVLPSTPPLTSYAPSPQAETPAPPPYETGLDTPPDEFQGCGYPCRDSYDCYGSCPICCQNQTCCSEEPLPLPLPLYAAPSSAPTSPPLSQPPFYPPSAGSDEVSDGLPVPVLPPPLFPIPDDIAGPAVMPPPGYVYSPYQVHGCGYPCSDSNDCDAPCMICANNFTCAYDYD